jgi:hypothetical protein
VKKGRKEDSVLNKPIGVYRVKEILMSLVLGVLWFFLAGSSPVTAITLIAFFAFLNLMRIDRLVTELKKNRTE